MSSNGLQRVVPTALHKHTVYQAAIHGLEKIGSWALVGNARSLYGKPLTCNIAHDLLGGAVDPAPPAWYTSAVVAWAAATAAR